MSSYVCPAVLPVSHLVHLFSMFPFPRVPIIFYFRFCVLLYISFSLPLLSRKSLNQGHPQENVDSTSMLFVSILTQRQNTTSQNNFSPQTVRIFFFLIHNIKTCWKLVQISIRQKQLYAGVLFRTTNIKYLPYSPKTFFKNGLYHRCITGNFAQFFRKAFNKNPSGRLILPKTVIL